MKRIITAHLSQERGPITTDELKRVTEVLGFHFTDFNADEWVQEIIRTAKEDVARPMPAPWLDS